MNKKTVVDRALSLIGKTDSKTRKRAEKEYDKLTKTKDYFEEDDLAYEIANNI